MLHRIFWSMHGYWKALQLGREKLKIYYFFQEGKLFLKLEKGKKFLLIKNILRVSCFTEIIQRSKFNMFCEKYK